MRYYAVTFSCYLLLFAVLFLYLKRPGREESRTLRQTYYSEGKKNRSKAERRSRKGRVKHLPLKQRVLFWLWHGSTVFLMVLPVALFALFRHYFTARFYIPESALGFCFSGASSFALCVGSLLIGTVLSICFSYLTYTRSVAQADRLYRVSSVQEYSKRTNTFISVILTAVGLFAIILSFNCYRFVTPREIVIKPAFAIEEKTYRYIEVDFVEKRVSSRYDTIDYTAYFSDGKKYMIFDDERTEAVFVQLLEKNSIEIRDISAKRISP